MVFIEHKNTLHLTTASLRVGEHNQDDTKTRLHTNKQGVHKIKKKAEMKHPHFHFLRSRERAGEQPSREQLPSNYRESSLTQTEGDCEIDSTLCVPVYVCSWCMMFHL